MCTALPSWGDALSQALIGLRGRLCRCEALLWLLAGGQDLLPPDQRLMRTQNKIYQEPSSQLPQLLSSWSPCWPPTKLLIWSSLPGPGGGHRAMSRARTRLWPALLPQGWGGCFPLTAGLENTSAPTFSESQLFLLLAHFLELARICPLILANSSRSQRITAVTVVHRFHPRALRDGMIS